MEQQWVAVHYFNHAHEAHMAKNLLEASAIEVIFYDELMTQVYIYGQVSGGIRLMVRPGKVVSAINILKKGGYIVDTRENLRKKLPSVVIPSNKELEVCPYCGSDNIRHSNKPDVITTFFYSIFGFMLPAQKIGCQCFDCDQKWRFVLSKRKKE